MLGYLLFRARDTFKDSLRTVPRSKHCQYVLDRQTATPNNRFSPKNIGVHRYPLQDSFLVHSRLSRARLML